MKNENNICLLTLYHLKMKMSSKNEKNIKNENMCRKYENENK